MNHQRRNIGMIGLLFILLFALTPFVRELWLPDEPRYAEIAREMLDTGEWLIPHLNGEIYTEKPAFYFWILAGSATLFGSWHPAVLIAPALLATLGCLLVTYWFAAYVFQRQTAFVTVLIVMTMGLFLGVGQMVRMDMLLLLCITLALYCFYRVYTGTSAHDWGYALTFFGATALGTLIKGPIGIGLPGLIIVVFLLWDRQFAVFNKWRLLWGSLLYFAIVLAWFLAVVSAEGWDYAYLILIKQNIGRVYNSWSHARPWYYYLFMLPVITLPWFPFFVSAAIRQYRSAAAIEEQTAFRFLWSWVGTTLVFFSLVSGKLAIYLLPLFPPLAMLVGTFWNTFISSPPDDHRNLRYITVPAYVLAGILLSAAIALVFVGEIQPYWMGILLLEGLGGVLLYSAIKRSPRLILGVILGLMLTIVLYGNVAVIPTLNHDLSFQPLDHELREFPIQPGSLAAWQVFPVEARFFLPTHITMLLTHEDTVAFFASDSPVYCFVKLKNLEQLRSELDHPLYVLGTYSIEHRLYVLTSQVPE